MLKRDEEDNQTQEQLNKSITTALQFNRVCRNFKTYLLGGNNQ